MKKIFEQLSLFNYKHNKIKSPPAPEQMPQTEILNSPPQVNSDTLQSLTATTEELQKRIKNVENNSQATASTLQTSITQNANNITALSGSVSSLSSNISSLQSSVSALQSANTTNQSNISSLQSAVSTNTSTLSTLSSTVSTNADNISQNTTNIASLSSRVSACESSITQLGGSPSGAGSELFTIPNVDFKGPVYSVYDTLERKYVYALTHQTRLQKIFFLVDKFTTFTLDLSITISALAYSSPQYLELYLDGELVDAREYNIAQDQTLSFDFSLSHYSTTGYHYYSFMVNSGLYFSNYQHHLYSSAKLYGKNALFLSRKNLINSYPCPNGTYYLTRTVNGYAQYTTFATGTSPTNLTWANIPDSTNFYGAGHSYLPYYTIDANQNITKVADFLFFHMPSGQFKLYNYTEQTQTTSSDSFGFIGQSSWSFVNNYNGVSASTLDAGAINGYSNYVFPFDNRSGRSLERDYYAQFNIPIPQFFADSFCPKELVAFNTNTRPNIAFQVDQNGMLTALANFPKPIRQKVAVQIDFGSQPNAYFINDNGDMVVLYNQYNFIKSATLVLNRSNWTYTITNTQILGNAQEMRMGWGTDLFTINNEKIIKV